jgi:hypothetical protein
MASRQRLQQSKSIDQWEGGIFIGKLQNDSNNRLDLRTCINPPFKEMLDTQGGRSMCSAFAVTGPVSLMLDDLLVELSHPLQSFGVEMTTAKGITRPAGSTRGVCYTAHFFIKPPEDGPPEDQPPEADPKVQAAVLRVCVPPALRAPKRCSSQSLAAHSSASATLRTQAVR